jgi:UDP-N-acetylmuramoylalanine--D-glutamate ligase
MLTIASWLQDEEDDMKGATGRGPVYRRRLAGKTVSVVGLARSGVAAARLLRRVGGNVLASDAADRGALSPEARALEREGCAVWTGGHPDAAFAGAELVVVSPGVPLTLPALVRVRARGVPIVGELELAWRAMEADVIAITGTNGKTTTTALTGELLRGQVRPVLVGGNIGTPLSEHALDFPADGIVVAEASSFQLESTALFRPRVAAVLNITPDHLDRHGSLERYVEAKARILANQTEADCAVLNADDPGAAALAARARGRVLWFSRTRQEIPGVFVDGAFIAARLNGHVERICPVSEIALPGRHNLENALAATACVLWTGMAPEAIRRGLAAFRGVAHRIERVREEGGVVYYNDSKGTNVDSTIKALESFAEPIVLIAGGKGKGQDFAPLTAAARGRVHHAVLIGEDKDRLRGPLEAAGAAVEIARSMEAAVRAARAAARPGDVVLLSPACASFDMFDNFEHRGDVFRAAVLRLPA